MTFFVDDMEKTGLNGYVYDFSVDFDVTPVDDILDIHRYLMKKHDRNNVWIFQKVFFYSNDFFFSSVH